MLALFLCAWALGSDAAVREGPRTRDAVVWLVAADEHGSVASGARMGAEEMTRTASLLGAKFVLHVISGDSVKTRLTVDPPAFVVTDLDGPQACQIATRFRNTPAVIVMNTGLTNAQCDTPMLWLRVPDPQRDRALGAAGIPEGSRVEEWHAGLQRFGAQELNERYERWAHEPMSAGAWIGWIAIKIAAEASLRLPTVSRAALVGARAPTFDGHKGVPLRFDRSGVLQQPACVVDRSGGLIKEVP